MFGNQAVATSNQSKRFRNYGVKKRINLYQSLLNLCLHEGFVGIKNNKVVFKSGNLASLHACRSTLEDPRVPSSNS
ncbi:Uncharacterised protein [Escherichia coli]|nr:Uncharacterised protein [Escherichia coli]